MSTHTPTKGTHARRHSVAVESPVHTHCDTVRRKRPRPTSEQAIVPPVLDDSRPAPSHRRASVASVSPPWPTPSRNVTVSPIIITRHRREPSKASNGSANIGDPSIQPSALLLKRRGSASAGPSNLKLSGEGSKSCAGNSSPGVHFASRSPPTSSSRDKRRSPKPEVEVHRQIASHACNNLSPHVTPRSAQVYTADGIELYIDCCDAVDAYNRLRCALEAEKLPKVPRYLKCFIKSLKDRRVELGCGAPIVRNSFDYIQARETFDFHCQLLCAKRDTFPQDLQGTALTDKCHEMLDLIDSAWGALHEFLRKAQNISMSLCSEIDVLPNGDEATTLQLRRVSAMFETKEAGSSTLTALIEGIKTYLRMLSGPPGRPGAKLVKRRPTLTNPSVTVDSSAAANGFTPGRSSTDSERSAYEHSADVLTGKGFDTFKLSLRASLIVVSSVSSVATYALDFPRPEAEQTDVYRGQSGTVVAATLSQWVRMLTDTIEVNEEDYTDNLDTFLLFFRQFTTPRELLQTLKDRYLETPSSNVDTDQLRAWRRYHRHAKLFVAKIVFWWLKWYWVDEQDRPYLDNLIEFVMQMVARDDTFYRGVADSLALGLTGVSAQHVNYVRHTQRLEENIDNGSTSMQEETSFKYQSEKLKNMTTGPKAMSLNVIDTLMLCGPGGSEAVARELTLMESKLFHSILPEEVAFLGTEPSQNSRVRQWTQFTNSVTLMVADLILVHTKAENRARIYAFFVKAAVQCRRLRNFNSALAICLGLKQLAIDRLEEMKELVGPYHTEQLDEVHNLFFGSPNYSGYREELKQPGPAVPLIPVLKRDVIHISDVYKRDYQDSVNRRNSKARESEQLVGTEQPVPDGSKRPRMIRISYYRNLRKVVRDIERCYGNYNIATDEFVHQWIEAYRKPLELQGKEYDAKVAKLYEKSQASHSKSKSR
ncbi:unnamed protein product [Somion occarium]|uniref:Ras GEF n=1 Tax=Somion occarium TaxID=3059160 RepID=A0ABP1DYL4_9APHY